MPSTIVLSQAQRKGLLNLYRHGPDPQVSHRAHLILPLADGSPCTERQSVLLTRRRTIPKVGSMWMRRGQQATVATPGTNDKRYLAGSVNWRTGRLIQTVGRKRDGELFVRHLDDLRRQLRCYRVIHVICDNARFHVAK